MSGMSGGDASYNDEIIPKLHPLYSRYEPDEFFQFKYNNVATRKIAPKIVPIKKSRETSEDSNDMFM
jgi:hypothetical protein